MYLCISQDPSRDKWSWKVQGLSGTVALTYINYHM